MDSTVFDTEIQLDEDSIVKNITYSYYDEQSDHHTETIVYSADPFEQSESDVTAALDFPELTRVEQLCEHSEHVCPMTTLSRGEKLAEDLLSRALAPSTLKQYGYALKKWTSFCTQNGLSQLPANPRDVASCVALCASETASVSAADTLAASIAFEHVRNFLPSPTQHPSFSLLMRSVRMNFGRERTPATPLSSVHLRLLMDHLLRTVGHGENGQLAPLVVWRTVWRIVMEFYTLGRFSDVTSLRRKNLLFKAKPKPHLIVKFLGGKNDVYSEGSERIVPSNAERNYCPVQLTRLYLQRLGEGYSGAQSEGYLVPRVRCSKDGTQRAEAHQRLSYTTAAEDFKRLLNSVGIPAAHYTEHSGKRGAATVAAEMGVSTSDLQRMGGWASQKMAAKYTDVSLTKRLALADNLHGNY